MPLGAAAGVGAGVGALVEPAGGLLPGLFNIISGIYIIWERD